MKRPSASTVIAVVALILAMGSGAYAAFQLPKESVGTRELKDDAVISRKVRNGSLRAPDVRPGELPFVEYEQIARPPGDLVLSQDLSPVVSLGDHSSEMITVTGYTRLVASGTVTIRNTGTATPIAECELAISPDFAPTSFIEFSFESAETAPPGPIGYLTLPVSGTVAKEEGTWEVAIRCKNATSDNSDLEVLATHLNVIAVPRSNFNSP